VDKGERSSTATNKAIIAAAVGAVDPAAQLAIEKTINWRFGYVKHWNKMVENQCQSPVAAIQVAEAGLAKVYELFEFVAPDGSSVSFEKAMKDKTSESFFKGTIQGQGKAPSQTLEIPYHKV
jgi:hypothetical protein